MKDPTKPDHPFRIYKRRKQPPWRLRVRKFFELFLRTALLMIFPALPAFICVVVWYKLCFVGGLCFDEKMEGVTIALIQVVGLIYGLLVAVLLTTVWNKYNKVRLAVKDYDVYTFAKLRHEQISPLIYALVTVNSLTLLGGFMLLKYHQTCHGYIVVGSVAYLLALIFFVMREIDDPIGGFWFIRGMPPEWLELDAKQLVKIRQEMAKKGLHRDIVALLKIEVNVNTQGTSAEASGPGVDAMEPA